MVDFLGSVFQTGNNVIVLQIRKILEDFRLTHPSRQQVQHIFDSNTQPPYTRASSARLRVERDSGVHSHRLTRGCIPVKIRFLDLRGQALFVEQFLKAPGTGLTVKHNEKLPTQDMGRKFFT